MKNDNETYVSSSVLDPTVYFVAVDFLLLLPIY